MENDLDKLVVEACESSKTMAEAMEKVGIPYTSFKRKAIKLGVWEPNQGGKGTYKVIKQLADVFSGKVPMSSGQLRMRLVREGFKTYACEKCNINEWQGNKLSLELDHINGNNKDNRLENLRILCPNCHSQTPTFRNTKR